jgi:hypothetical protein
MILEGIVTTISAEGAVNIAPMGPSVEESMQRFVLRPYRTAKTYQNLKACPEGVLHITDDVLLLARAAIGPVEPLPDLERPRRVQGFVLHDCCRYFEFRVQGFDDSGERSRLDAQIVHAERVRDFFGFNRAKHAVIEAAILATRTAFLPRAEIEGELSRLETIVRKTGGERESEAFALLRDHVRHAREQEVKGAELAR